MRSPVASILLALVWVLMAGSFSAGNLVLGLAISVGVLAVLRTTSDLRPTWRSLLRFFPFAVYYLVDLLGACLQVARQVMQPLDRLRPAVIEVRIDSRTDLEVALLANLLSYSPGTLFLEVSKQRDRLFMHVISAHDLDEVREKVREDLERHVLGVLR